MCNIPLYIYIYMTLIATLVLVSFISCFHVHFTYNGNLCRLRLFIHHVDSSPFLQPPTFDFYTWTCSATTSDRTIKLTVLICRHSLRTKEANGENFKKKKKKNSRNKNYPSNIKLLRCCLFWRLSMRLKLNTNETCLVTQKHSLLCMEPCKLKII